jgi:hypothetical protein
VKHGPTDLLESFAACLMKITLEHRGDYGINLVNLFAPFAPVSHRASTPDELR